MDISDMHRIIASILDVSYALQNTNVLFHERVCVSPPHYYLKWFEKYYQNIPLNWDDVPFPLQCITGFKVKIQKYII